MKNSNSTEKPKNKDALNKDDPKSKISLGKSPLKKSSAAKNPQQDPNKLGISVKSKHPENPLSQTNQDVDQYSLGGKRDKDEIRKKRAENLENVLLSYFLGSNIEEQDFAGNVSNFDTHYFDEKDFVPGDYVIIFPNPDHEVYKRKLQYTFNFNETLQMLSKLFVTTISKDHSYSNAFNKAFALAFKQLNDSDKIGRKPKYIARINKKSGDKKEAPNNELYDGMDIKFYDEKINVGGGYLTQVIPEKGKSISKKNIPWVRSNESTKDLCTLIRNTIMVKLGKEYGFHMRSFLSDDGEKIYLVLHGELSNLYLMAERAGMDKEIEFAIADIMSLEPIDSSMRPLRLHSFIQNDNYLSENKMENNKEIIKLRDDIRKELKLLNYKRVAYLVQCPLYYKDSEYSKIRDEAHVNIKTWKIYLQYLQEVAGNIDYWRFLFLNTSPKEHEKELALYEAQKLKRGPQTKLVNVKYVEKANEDARKRKEKMRIKENTQIIRRVRMELFAQKCKEIFHEGLKKIQKIHGKNSLMTLWNIAGTKRFFDSFTDFYNPSTRNSMKNKNRLSAAWKKYQINEIGNILIFFIFSSILLIII